MKKKKVISLMSTILLVSALLFGCSSGKDAEKSGEKTEKKEEFVYAMSGLYKPFNYKEDGKLTGFDVEIGEALAEKMGMTAKSITFPFETMIQGLIDKKFDAILGSMTITPERLKVVNFTDTYYRSGSQIFVSEDNTDIKSADDAKGKKIGTTPATNYEQDALKLTDKANVITYPQGDIGALMDLETGRVEAVVADNIFGQMAIDTGKLKVKPVGDLIGINEQAIAVNKDNQELTDKINKALAEIIADGTYEKISMKWFGFNLMDETK
ncbi:transporter substrate-binding domain-containing protein [Psychrobacillus sp. L4]|uniref:transporter substrate-binding domain-containing protein n=1 Tax=Psychrobacillus sp. L4 TaxID=3236892 RepID=UPI0036F1F0A6